MTSATRSRSLTPVFQAKGKTRLRPLSQKRRRHCLKRYERSEGERSLGPPFLSNCPAVQWRRKMVTLNLRWLFLALSITFPTLSNAQDPMIELSLSDPSRWDYFSDQVMGGVSSGSASFEQDGGQSILRLTGDVSTANNGGFISSAIKVEPRLTCNRARSSF